MTRIAWGTAGERYFEAGTDRGVLYINGAGFPWNGLTGVSEAPDGGDPQPFYIDGYKYLNLAAAEEFKATVNALSSPKEFGECDGTISIHNGLFATQQPRKPFDLAYRTLVGNDISGIDHGYKLHLVYNALAAPSTRENSTTGDKNDPLALSWAITTTPPRMNGMKPTAHLVIDSRITPKRLMDAIEDILYGTDEADPRIPDQDELITLFDDASAPVIATNKFLNPDADGPYLPGGLTVSTDWAYQGTKCFYLPPNSIDAATSVDSYFFRGDLTAGITRTVTLPSGYSAQQYMVSTIIIDSPGTLTVTINGLAASVTKIDNISATLRAYTIVHKSNNSSARVLSITGMTSTLGRIAISSYEVIAHGDLTIPASSFGKNASLNANGILLANSIDTSIPTATGVTMTAVGSPAGGWTASRGMVYPSLPAVLYSLGGVNASASNLLAAIESGTSDYAYITNISANSTLIVVGRDDGQRVKLGANVYYTQGEEPLVVYTSSTVGLQLGPGYWDLITIVDGQYNGPPFSGNTVDPLANFVWNGDPDNSTSSISSWHY